MADKILNTRILLKHATLDEWNSSSLILKKGEVAFATVPTVEGSTLEPVMLKVGDGSKTFAQLDWASAKAADVYGWAKAAGLPVDTTKAPEGQFVEGFAWENNKLVPKFRGFITEINEANKDKLDAPTTKAVKDYVDAEVQKAVSGGVEGLATEKYVDDAITALSAEGGAIKAVADDLAAHEQAFEEFKTANTQAITDAVAAEAAIARAAEKANADAIDAIEANYLKAADLNDYAKTADVPNIKVNNAGTADKVANALTVGSKTYDGSAAVEVTASDLGLESAMHFVGAFTEAPANPKPGDVYLNTATKKEYVYDTTNGWVELGDEGSYALRTVTITGTDGLTGGGDLTANRTIGLSEDTKSSLAKADSALQAADIVGKADKVTGATANNFAGLDANGNLIDSGKKAADFATAAQGAKADTAVQSVTLASGTNNGTLKLTVDGASTDNISVTGLGSAAYTNSDAYDAAGAAETAKEEAIAKALENTNTAITGIDTGVMSVTANDTADKQSGIKVDNTDPKNPKVEVDDTITWFFDCGGAE